jgi:hypothetical protein
MSGNRTWQEAINKQNNNSNPMRAADSPDDLDFHRQLIDPTTPFERSFIRCGGVAVGDPVALVEQCHVAASEYGKHMQRLADSPLRSIRGC